jgi:hypothetical protein
MVRLSRVPARRQHVPDDLAPRHRTAGAAPASGRTAAAVPGAALEAAVAEVSVMTKTEVDGPTLWASTG